MRIGRPRLKVLPGIQLGRMFSMPGPLDSLRPKGGFGIGSSVRVQIPATLAQSAGFGIGSTGKAISAVSIAESAGFGIGGNSTAGSFDADYAAVLNYAITQGYTLPSSAQQDLQNALVIELKSNLIWDELDSFGVFAGDGNNDFARIDWVRLITMTEVNSPTFTINQGYNGDGATSYIDTGFSPSTDATKYTQDDASWFSWINTANSTGQFWLGQADGRNGIRLANSDAQRINSSSNANNAANISSTLGNTFVMFSRSNATNFEIDLTDITTEVNTNLPKTASSTALTSGNFLIGSWFGAFANAQSGFFGLGSNLSSKRLELFNSLKNYYSSL